MEEERINNTLNLRGIQQDNIKIVAVVQCAIALERCSGFHCMWSFHRRQHFFSGYSPGVMYIPLSCGGCPGRRLSRLLANLVKGVKRKEGLDKQNIAVHLTACVVNDNGHYPRCPFTDYMKAIIKQKGFTVVEGGYESCMAKGRREHKQYACYGELGQRGRCQLK